MKDNSGKMKNVTKKSQKGKSSMNSVAKAAKFKISQGFQNFATLTKLQGALLHFAGIVLVPVSDLQQ